MLDNKDLAMITTCNGHMVPCDHVQRFKSHLTSILPAALSLLQLIVLRVFFLFEALQLLALPLLLVFESWQEAQSYSAGFSNKLLICLLRYT